MGEGNLRSRIERVLVGGGGIGPPFGGISPATLRGRPPNYTGGGVMPFSVVEDRSVNAALVAVILAALGLPNNPATRELVLEILGSVIVSGSVVGGGRHG